MIGTVGLTSDSKVTRCVLADNLRYCQHCKGRSNLSQHWCLSGNQNGYHESYIQDSIIALETVVILSTGFVENPPHEAGFALYIYLKCPK